MKSHNLADIIERFQTRHALREERAQDNFHTPIEGAVFQLGSDNNGRAGKSRLAMEKLRVFTDPGWDVSLWFAVLSPVFGILAGLLAAFLIYH